MADQKEDLPMNKRFPRSRLLIALILSVLLMSLGCYQERLDQFTVFATAGSQYVQAFHKLVTAAGSAMIAANSAVLSEARIDAAKGKKTVSSSEVVSADGDAAANLKQLGIIDQHASALDAYFDAISKLTSSNLNASMEASATGLYTSVRDLYPKVNDVVIDGKSLQSFVKPTTNLILTIYKVKILDGHLKKAVPIIDKALALQEAAVDCIGAVMQSDLKSALEYQESTTVIAPFTAPFDFAKGPPPLPPTWNSDREAFLRAKVTLDSLNEAKSAIKDLHTAFQQLVAAKASPNLASILNEINKMAVDVSAIESSKTFITIEPAKTATK
jgi:hypothetical protein